MEALDKASKSTVIGLKIFFVAAAAGVIVLAKTSHSWRPLGINPADSCITDLGQSYTTTMNIIVQQYVHFGKVLQLLSSLMVDFVTIYSMTMFATTANSARLVYSLVLFYGIRALIQVN